MTIESYVPSDHVTDSNETMAKVAMIHIGRIGFIREQRNLRGLAILVPLMVFVAVFEPIHVDKMLDPGA